MDDVLTANSFLLYPNAMWTERTYSDNVFHHNTAVWKGSDILFSEIMFVFTVL